MRKTVGKELSHLNKLIMLGDFVCEIKISFRLRFEIEDQNGEYNDKESFFTERLIYAK